MDTVEGPKSRALFDHLSPPEFEAFCCDLLRELGFANISWRKGTGLSPSPSDSGRDIECEFKLQDVDGSQRLERWFVECKHFGKGVPPTELQGLLSWATAEGPDVALIISSGFLSNPCKDYLEDYQRTNKPRFRIKKWERPDLERLILGKSILMRKYELAGNLGFLSILHPAHALYLKGFKINSLNSLFELLDGLDPERRDGILSWVDELIIRPRYRKPTSDRERIRDLRIDEVSYEAFKRKCHEIVSSGFLDQRLLTYLIVSIILTCQISISDMTATDVLVRRLKDADTHFKHQLDQQADGKEKDQLRSFLRWNEERILNADSIVRDQYDLYEYFCENVVKPLLSEDLLTPDAEECADFLDCHEQKGSPSKQS